jgi:hypothetical protein
MSVWESNPAPRRPIEMAPLLPPPVLHVKCVLARESGFWVSVGKFWARICCVLCLFVEMTDVYAQFGERIGQLLRMSDKQRHTYMEEKKSKRKKKGQDEEPAAELSSQIYVCNPFALTSKMMQCTAPSFAHSNKARPMCRCCPPIKKLIRNSKHRKASARPRCRCCLSAIPKLLRDVRLSKIGARPEFGKSCKHPNFRTPCASIDTAAGS